MGYTMRWITREELQEWRGQSARVAMKKSGRRLWTDHEDEYLRKHWADTTLHEVEKRLNRSRYSIYGRVTVLGLSKDPEFKLRQNQELGRRLAATPVAIKNRIKPGTVPPNKGVKGVWAPGSEKSWFKKGHRPQNTLFDGAVTIRRHNKRGTPPYMWIRLGHAKWQMYHVYRWEQKNGPVPEGHVVVFRDGDTLNPDPVNLELITNAELARRNRNTEKAMQTMDLIRQGKRKPKKITNWQAARRLSGDDKDMAAYLMKHQPDLVKVARLNYELKREIRHARHSE